MILQNLNPELVCIAILIIIIIIKFTFYNNIENFDNNLKYITIDKNHKFKNKNCGITNPCQDIDDISQWAVFYEPGANNNYNDLIWITK